MTEALRVIGKSQPAPRKRVRAVQWPTKDLVPPKPTRLLEKYSTRTRNIEKRAAERTLAAKHRREIDNMHYPTRALTADERVWIRAEALDKVRRETRWHAFGGEKRSRGNW